MEAQKSMNIQSNPEQKAMIELYWASKKNSMLLTQKKEMKTSGTEDPRINPHSYSHLIFDKGAKNLH
jgi:hypothetical protein